LYPETNSDSASGKSNGTRFVSAKAEIKNKKKLKNNGKTNQTLVWNKTISLKFNDPTHNSIVIIIIPIETSYETNCAAERKAPKKAYLLFEDQPDIIIPYTPNDEIENKNIKPKFISDKTTPYDNGKTDQPNKLTVKLKTGEAINNTRLDNPGIIVSLNINLKASAKGCKSPIIPTTFGPLLRCIPANNFRSNNVNNATIKKIGNIGGKIFINSISKAK